MMLSNIFKTNASYLLRVFTILMIAPLSGCDGSAEQAGKVGEETLAADYERGPNRGRLLVDGSFAAEITIFEAGVPPRFHVYPYVHGRLVDPAQVGLTIWFGLVGRREHHCSFQSGNV